MKVGDRVTGAARHPNRIADYVFEGTFLGTMSGQSYVETDEGLIVRAEGDVLPAYSPEILAKCVGHRYLPIRHKEGGPTYGTPTSTLRLGIVLLIPEGSDVYGGSGPDASVLSRNSHDNWDVTIEGVKVNVADLIFDLQEEERENGA